MSVIEAVIREVKGSGFWNNDTERRIRTVARDLLRAGADEVTVANSIREMWSIGRVEYGE